MKNIKDVLVLVATGFEDTELVSTINVFQRNDISYDLISVENKAIVKGQNEAFVETKKLNTIKIDDYRSLFLPGGKGHILMLENKKIINIIKYYKDKYIFAICAAPTVLLAAGVINGYFTSFPGFAKNPKNTGNAIEVAEKIITGRDYIVTIDFANEIVKKLK